MRAQGIVVRLTVLGALAFGMELRVAESALIVGYSGVPTPVVSSAPGVTNAGISRGSGLGVAGGGNYASNSWTTAASPDANDYVQWGWTASTATYGHDLDDLQIQYKKTGSGPDDLQIQISVNGGAFTTVFTDTSVATQDEFHNINLTAYNNVTSAIFRLYGYNANNASGQLDLTNYVTSPSSYAVTVNGVVSTPEPGSLAVFGLGGLVAGIVGWRRRKATAAQND